MLTKTAYLAYSQCPKQLWLDAYRPELAAPPDPTAQRRLRAGQAVDQLAREQFVNGRSIPYRPQPEEMAPLTRQAMAEGAETLFQATFHEDDLLVKVDILTQTAGGWHLIEVKSSTQYKEAEHLPDIAFQVYVLRQAGLSVAQASLMHLNSDCLAPDLSNLFALTDVTEAVEAFLPTVAADTAVMRQLLTHPNPPPERIGRHCKRPYDCPFYDHCWQGRGRA
ncbi:MAG: Dna2/Cas4 domain-containing protein [Chloroflexota bacterium]